MRYPPSVNLTGRFITLRSVTDADIGPIAAILAEPEVARWWGAYDRARVARQFVEGEADVGVFVIETDGEVVGLM